MTNLLPETVDYLFNELGYQVTMESTSMHVDRCPSSVIHAEGLDNAETDRDKIIEYLSENGMGIIRLEINSSQVVNQQYVIGQMQPTTVNIGYDVSLEVECYTDNIPDGQAVLKPYVRSIPLHDPEPETDDFELGGQL